MSNFDDDTIDGGEAVDLDAVVGESTPTDALGEEELLASGAVTGMRLAGEDAVEEDDDVDEEDDDEGEVPEAAF